MNEMNNGENNNQNIEQQNMNQNNVVESVKEQPVNEAPKKEEKKSYFGLLVVFMVISLLLAGFIIYDKVIKKEEIKTIEPKTENLEKTELLQKIDNSKNWVYMEKIAEYEIVNAKDGKNVNVTYEYPVINIDSVDAKKFNDDSKKEVVDKNTEFLNHDPNRVGCSEPSDDPYSYIINNGQKKYVGYYDLDSYKIIETDDYIVVMFEAGFTPTSSIFCDWVNGVNVFAISKKDGKKISNKELVKLQGYDYDSILKKIYEKYYLDNKEYYDNSCNNNSYCLKANPTEADYNSFIDDRAIVMLKQSNELEIFVHPIEAGFFVEHYSYSNGNLTLIDED